MRRLVLLVLPLLAPFVRAQAPLVDGYVAPGVSGYSGAVPTPEDVLGYRIGERHTTPAEAVRYVEAVAAASERVTVQQHGATHEGRPLVHAVVTSPANHARLEALRQANLRLSDAPASVSDAELATRPAVVYLGYSIHGNEASGTEAALLLLYHLAAGEGAGVEALLDETVLLLDPLLNPDGRDRFADWANGWRTPGNPGPAAAPTTTSSTSTATGFPPRTPKAAPASPSSTPGAPTTSATSTRWGARARSSSSPASRPARIPSRRRPTETSPPPSPRTTLAPSTLRVPSTIARSRSTTSTTGRARRTPT
jgi:hypothetical protein